MNLREAIKSLEDAHSMLSQIQTDPKSVCEWYGVDPEDLILVEQELMEQINALEDKNIKGYVENKCVIINDYNLNIEGIESELNRLKELKDIYEKKVEKAKKDIDWIMRITHTEKLDTKLNRISYRKSESVLIKNSELIPEEYWREKIEKTVDKTAVKNAIKSGVVIEGAVIEEKQNLQIK